MQHRLKGAGGAAPSSTAAPRTVVEAVEEEAPAVSSYKAPAPAPKDEKTPRFSLASFLGGGKSKESPAAAAAAPPPIPTRESVPVNPSGPASSEQDDAPSFAAAPAPASASNPFRYVKPTPAPAPPPGPHRVGYDCVAAHLSTCVPVSVCRLCAFAEVVSICVRCSSSRVCTGPCCSI